MICLSVLKIEKLRNYGQSTLKYSKSGPLFAANDYFTCYYVLFHLFHQQLLQNPDIHQIPFNYAL